MIPQELTSGSEPSAVKPDGSLARIPLWIDLSLHAVPALALIFGRLPLFDHERLSFYFLPTRTTPCFTFIALPSPVVSLRFLFLWKRRDREGQYTHIQAELHIKQTSSSSKRNTHRPFQLDIHHS